MTSLFGSVTTDDVLSRLFFWSFDVHTAQEQPGIGTPVEVPQPRTVSVAYCLPCLSVMLGE